MLPMFYEKVSALSLVSHQDASIEASGSFSFAAESNAIAVGVSEFAQALSNYPIIFVSSGATVIPMVVTGLKDKQNLFVDAEGGWDATYIPAYVRRYPFVVAEGQDDVLTVCVDEAYTGFNRENRGESLFEGEKQTPYLNKVTNFLQEYEKEMLITREFTQRLLDLDLLEDSQAVIERTGGEPTAINGFKVVSREKLNSLSAEELCQLQRGGYLEFIYLHLTSLQRFDALFQKLVEA